MTDVIRKMELYQIIKNKTGLPIKRVEKAVRITLREIGLAVQRDGAINIHGFGRFKRWYFKGQLESLLGYIPPEWRVRFRPSPALKAMVNHEREIPPVPGMRSRDYSSKCKR